MESNNIKWTTKIEDTYSPSKLIRNFDKKKSITSQQGNKTADTGLKNKTYLLNGEITKDYLEEDESEGINISYKKPENKLKLITLDLLLKKITLENFIDKNPLCIFYFAQQCYCFINKDIIFNKIINCYNYYKEKKLSILQIKNLIIFLNILIIEMYEYYTSIKTDESYILLLKNFYNSLIYELVELINKGIAEKKQSKNMDTDLEQKNNIKAKRERSISLEDPIKAKNKTTEKNNFYIGLNSIISKRDFMLKRSPIVDIEAINKIMEQIKEDEKNKKGFIRGKEIKDGIASFFHLKKDIPVKVDVKNEINEEKNNKFLKRANAVKVQGTPEEELLTSIKDIYELFSIEKPINRELRIAKNSMDFYKDIKSKITNEISNKSSSRLKKRRSMAKSVTERNVTKQKLILHENEGYFNVLDWDEKEIGEKLLTISKNLLCKVERREIYKAIYLKKNKGINCPNVMENIDKFNRLTFFIIQDILSYDYPKERAKIIEKWIKVADYCKSRKDYNDCLAINSALNNYIITGLYKTLKEINSEKREILREISEICQVHGNYKKLREDMNNLQKNEFYVPYLGILLKDLAFFEENSKYVENGVLINFEKLEKIQLAIEDFFKFKNIIDKNSFIPPVELDFFDNLETIEEDELDKLASNLEPEFKLSENKQKTKRMTNIDIKYFGDVNVKRPNMRNSSKLLKRIKK